VLLYGCDKDAQDFEFVSECGHRRFPYDETGSKRGTL
jgi:hypothetical protein